MPLSFERRLTYRGKSGKAIEEYAFDGGLVSDPYEARLELNQSPNEYNVLFNEDGSIKTRNGYLRYNNNPIGVSSDQANTATSTGVIVLDSNLDYVSQSFIPSGEIQTVQVDAYLEMTTSGEEQLVRAELWTDDSRPDELVAQSQIKLVSGTSETAYSFRIKAPETLSTATTYHVLIKPFVQGSSTDVNSVEVHHTGNEYANGQVYTSTDAGQTWTADATKDLKFVVYSGGDTGCSGLIRYYGDGGVSQTIAKFGNTLYRGNDTTGVMTSISLGNGGNLNATGFLDTTIIDGTLLVADGSSYIQKYRGSTNANYTTGTISVTNGSATVTGSGTSWATSTNAEAGEYIKLPDGKWYRITAIGSNTSLTIEVDYQGSTASGESYTISPWGEIQGDLNRSTAPSGLIRPTPTSISNHKDRLWTLNDNTLRFSAGFALVDGEFFNDFDSANLAGTILLPTSTGDTGKAIYSLGNALYVFQNRSISAVYGTSPANFELRNITNEVGLLDKRTLVEWNGVLIFLSHKGVVMFDGSNYKNVSEDFVQNEIDAWANSTSPVATLWGNKYIISYTPSGETKNEEVLFYDLVDKRWGKMKNVFAGAWSNWEGGNDDGRIYFGSSNQGSIYRWDIGSHDDGYEIESLYETPALGFGENMADKNLKRIYLQQLAQGEYNMELTYYLDGSSSGTEEEVSLSSGATALWDTAIWDTDTWPEEANVLTTRIDPQGNPKYIKLRFTQNGYDQGYQIIGVRIEGSPRRLA